MTSMSDYAYASTIVMGGVFAAMFFTSHIVYKKHLEEEVKELKEKNDKLKKKNETLENKINVYTQKEKYEDRYVIEKPLHNKDHCDLTKEFMFEYTPNGIIIMMYDTIENNFMYWSDSTIRFKYLQAASRRFVIRYQCSDYYVEGETNEESSDNNSTEDEDSIFVKSTLHKIDIESSKLTNVYVHKGKLASFYHPSENKKRSVKPISFNDYKRSNSLV